MTSNASIRDQVALFSGALSLIEPMIMRITNSQDLPSDQQILVPAAVLVCFCDALDMDPVVVVEQIRRARGDMNSAFHNEWAAMVEYARGELK